jgi:UDP-N-acetylglucosamine--dolichyl-phosphate N-acetylglucosaminephosphotransferase
MIYELIVILLYSIFFTYVAVQYFKRWLIKLGYAVLDKYKPGKKKMPTMGGLPMFVGIIVALSLSQLLLHDRELVGKLFIFYFIVTVYTMYGVVDDLFSFKKRYDKIITLLVLSFPIATLITTSGITVFGRFIEMDGLYPFVLAPIFIMVVANLVNLYAGFNGQATGLTLLLFMFAGIKSYLLYGMDNLIFLIPAFGALLVIFFFNFFPATLHEGNVGAFLIGSCLGAFLIINRLEVFGVIILIPHIVNFVMDTWILTVKKIPDVKFGKVRKDGTIEAPVSMRNKSIKFWLTHHLRLTERSAVLLLYIPTIVFGVIGVMWL